jgi:hypothetical protein
MRLGARWEWLRCLRRTRPSARQCDPGMTRTARVAHRTPATPLGCFGEEATEWGIGKHMKEPSLRPRVDVGHHAVSTEQLVHSGSELEAETSKRHDDAVHEARPHPRTAA